MRYDDLVRWLGLVVLICIGSACGQDDYFHAPNPGNLSKDPYDFSTAKYPRDLQFEQDALMILDDGGSDDMPASIDMAARDMKNTTSDHDMASH